MKTHTFSFAYCAYSPDDPQLPNMDKVMLRAAREVALRAYAPYSAFQVGAALRLRSGRIVLGSNQENAAFPAGICAERCALHAAAAQYPDDPPQVLAIAAWQERLRAFLTQPISPCGICRQALLETERRYGLALRLLLWGETEVVVLDSAADLLPLAFSDMVL